MKLLFVLAAFGALSCASMVPTVVVQPAPSSAAARQQSTPQTPTAPEPDSKTETIITEQMLADAAPDWIESCVSKFNKELAEHIKSDFCFCAHRKFVENIRHYHIQSLEELSRRKKAVVLSNNQTKECAAEALQEDGERP